MIFSWVTILWALRYGKVNVDCIAPCREDTSKVLSYGTHFQGISHTYTPRVHPLTESTWRDALETVINSRKLTDAQANPSTQKKRYLSPI